MIKQRRVSLLLRCWLDALRSARVILRNKCRPHLMRLRRRRPLLKERAASPEALFCAKRAAES